MRLVGSEWNSRGCARIGDQTHNLTRGTLLLLLAGFWLAGCRSSTEAPREEPPQAAAQTASQAAPAQASQAATEQESKPEVPPVAETDRPVSLFDGQNLGQWKVTDFGGQGPVYVKDGAIYMDMGSYMTGITWSGPVVRMNYEIELEAMRVQGNDFFCGLTFPVGENSCTLVLGGWGGSVCGLSSIDHFDASENPTTRIISFERGKWYHVRLRVEPTRILAWLDGEELVNQETTDHKIDIRVEVDQSQPLGIATWMTTGAVRDIYVKKLADVVQ